MAGKRNKIIMLNTLLLIFCCVIIALFCWSPKETVVLEKFKVNFETDGGTSIAAIEIEEGKIPERPEDPKREGYIFVGWMLGDELYDFTTPISKDATLKAVWKERDPEKKYFVVTIDLGDGMTSSQPVEEGEVPIAPTTPSREGYTFVGWEINGEPYDFTTPVSSDVTISAKWEENKPDEPDPNEGKEFTVRFNLNGGVGNAPDQTVVYKQRASRPADPTRAGYTFAGWSPNINNPITGDTTFTAQWNLIPPEPEKPKEYRVFYKLDGQDVCTGVQQWVAAGSSIQPQCNAPIAAHHQANGGWNCPNPMPNGPATCTMTSSVNTFKVICTPVGDALSATTCIMSLTENGNAVSGTISINGNTVNGAVSIARQWNAISQVNFTLSDGFSGTATK